MKREREPGKDIYSVNFAEYLPEPLKQDPKIQALASALTGQLLQVSENIDSVLIFSRFDELPEELIDILAFDMHVDWYDYSYPLDIKREILKDSVRVHKKMGTVYAVETAVRALHGDCKILEWFEYGGTPHCFKLILGQDKYKLDTNLEEIIRRVYMYKRLSAHLEAIELKKSIKKKVYVGAAGVEKISIEIPASRSEG